VEFRILGHLDVSADGRSVQLGGSRERTVLSMLLLEAGHVISVERLIDAVWDDDPPATARGQIQICISALRRRILAACGEDLIDTRRPGYLLRIAGHGFDLHDFEARVNEGRAARTAGDPAGAARVLRSALALWRGPALADIDSILTRQGVGRLDERRLAVIGETLECSLQAGEHHEAIGELRALVAERPLHEHFWALLMAALYSAGRQAEALDAYRAARTALREELGIEPGSELRSLHEALLSGVFPPPAALGYAARPPGAVRTAPGQGSGGGSAAAPGPGGQGPGGQRHERVQDRVPEPGYDRVRPDGRASAPRSAHQDPAYSGAYPDAAYPDSAGPDPYQDAYGEEPRREPYRERAYQERRYREQAGRDPEFESRDGRGRAGADGRESGRGGGKPFDAAADRGPGQGTAGAHGADPTAAAAPAASGAAGAGSGTAAGGPSAQARPGAGSNAGAFADVAAGAVRSPSLLPAAIPDFIGRDENVASVLRQLRAHDGGHGRGQAVPICVIVGPGGAGKTTLAVHVAHRLAAEFPDGQLFADLRAGDRPVSPSDILERFLRALGVLGPSLPRTLEERAELFRDLVSDRRLLIVLDDAMTERQVTCLLPGTADCAVLVTSRRRLTGLPSTGRVEIGALSEPGAVELLTHFVGPERVAADPEGVAELSRLCGRLPLALRICAARLAARPHWSVADLVDRLLDESRRLDELGHGEMTVRASISLTYDSLSDDARLLFRRLALLDVPNFAAWVGSPLLEVDVLRAQEALEVLAEAYLIDASPGPGGQVRYSFHDITRPFAQERLVEEGADERGAALERWLGALLSLTGEAHRREYAGGFLERRSPASRWRLPDRLVERLLADPLAWYEQERSAIVAAVRQAAVSGMVEHSWDLALSSVTIFEAHCYFDDWRETHEVALKAACRAGDLHGEAAMRYSLGSLHMFEQSSAPAKRQFDQAYALYEQLGDDHGAALVLRNMAYLDRLAGDLVSARARWEAALGVFQVSGDRIAEAHVLHNMAHAHLDCGEEDAALELLARADAICRQVGNRRVAAQVQNRMGELHLRKGRLDEAYAAYSAVLESVRAARDRVGECYALLGLAAVDRRRGRPDAAAARLTEALDLAVGSRARMAESRVALALGEVLLAGDLEAAQGYAQRALRGFEAIGATLQQAQAMVLRGRVRAAAGEAAGAKADWQAAGGVLAGLHVGDGNVALADEIRSLLRGGVAGAAQDAAPDASQGASQAGAGVAVGPAVRAVAGAEGPAD
jgi:DNA-binding SARP family transcriptional activator